MTLHSNPSETHTFVDERTKAFTGLIDFGDAYVSHPAFDLLRWPSARDREDLLAGYAAGAGQAWVDGAFRDAWRALSLLADLQAAARRPERSAELSLQMRATLARLSEA